MSLNSRRALCACCLCLGLGGRGCEGQSWGDAPCRPPVSPADVGLFLPPQPYRELIKKINGPNGVCPDK